tara:strand:+ start:127 stop:420 length:294 start_codon:yes stop_codon:yes gene_type:complete
MNNYNNQKERLNIVINIINKLKKYKIKNGSIINLYNKELCSFIEEFKNITNNYIKQDDNKEIKGFKGTLYFEEIGKNIEYNLPAYRNIEPLFVIRIK